MLRCSDHAERRQSGVGKKEKRGSVLSCLIIHFRQLATNYLPFSSICPSRDRKANVWQAHRWVENSSLIYGKLLEFPQYLIWWGTQGETKVRGFVCTVNWCSFIIAANTNNSGLCDSANLQHCYTVKRALLCRPVWGDSLRRAAIQSQAFVCLRGPVMHISAEVVFESFEWPLFLLRTYGKILCKRQWSSPLPSCSSLKTAFGHFRSCT